MSTRIRGLPAAGISRSRSVVRAGNEGDAYSDDDFGFCKK